MVRRRGRAVGAVAARRLGGRARAALRQLGVRRRCCGGSSRPPSHGNDFRTLPSRLFIGATDQDRREHVLFGGEGFDDVPISRAVQASCAASSVLPQRRDRRPLLHRRDRHPHLEPAQRGRPRRRPDLRPRPVRPADHRRARLQRPPRQHVDRRAGLQDDVVHPLRAGAQRAAPPQLAGVDLHLRAVELACAA